MVNTQALCLVGGGVGDLREAVLKGESFTFRLVRKGCSDLGLWVNRGLPCLRFPFTGVCR